MPCVFATVCIGRNKEGYRRPRQDCPRRMARRAYYRPAAEVSSCSVRCRSVGGGASVVYESPPPAALLVPHRGAEVAVLILPCAFQQSIAQRTRGRDEMVDSFLSIAAGPAATSEHRPASGGPMHPPLRVRPGCSRRFASPHMGATIPLPPSTGGGRTAMEAMSSSNRGPRRLQTLVSGEGIGVRWGLPVLDGTSSL